MRNRFAIFLLVAFASFTVWAATNGITVVPEQPLASSNGPYPTTKEDLWKLGIGIVTPLIVWGLAQIPDLPSPILPLLTPLLGLGIGLLLKSLNALHLSWMDMAQAGALGVFVREMFNQWVTQQTVKARAAKAVAKAAAVSPSPPPANP